MATPPLSTNTPTSTTNALTSTNNTKPINTSTPSTSTPSTDQISFRPAGTSELNYVRFDVGHYLYVCHKSTILRFEHSVLAKYVAPQFDRRKSQFDYIVIDRDGKHFGAILNFMRDQSSLELDTWPDCDLADLMREADFYCLTELIELCGREIDVREHRSRAEREREEEQQIQFVVPPDKKLEIIYGHNNMKGLLKAIKRPTMVISYRSMVKFHIHGWIEEILRVCDHSKYKIYCFAAADQEQCDRGLDNFIMTFYNPFEDEPPLTMSAPTEEKFRARRDYYKGKVFKFWFIVSCKL